MGKNGVIQGSRNYSRLIYPGERDAFYIRTLETEVKDLRAKEIGNRRAMVARLNTIRDHVVNTINEVIDEIEGNR